MLDWHTGLLYKLQQNNIGGLFYKLIKNMYEKTSLVVKNNRNNISDWFNVEQGIRQGDALSPTLFNIFVNEIPDLILRNNCESPMLLNSKVPCLMYADDIILFSETKEGLQNAINIVTKFCDEWELSMNINKTKVMIFNKAGKLLKHEFKTGTTILECVKNYTYLGIEMTPSGNFKTAKHTLYAKALKAYFKFCKMLGNNLQHIDLAEFLFDHTVKPILLYGVEVWGTVNLNRRKIMTCESGQRLQEAYADLPQEKLNIKLAKYLLQVPKNASNDAVLGELGRYPLYLNIIKQLFKYQNKLENLENGKLVKEAYNLDKSRSGKKQSTWCDTIEFITEELKIEKSTRQKQTKIFHKKVYSIAKQYYAKWWIQTINRQESKSKYHKEQGNKLRTYAKFKISFEKESYLNMKNTEYRKWLSKFRISNHKLAIESGRYFGIKLEDRICKLCTSDTVEDEKHFLVDCTHYNEVRDEFYRVLKQNSDSFQTLSKEHKFIWIMMSRTPPIVKALTKYITKAMAIREESLMSKE